MTISSMSAISPLFDCQEAGLNALIENSTALELPRSEADFEALHARKDDVGKAAAVHANR